MQARTPHWLWLDMLAPPGFWCGPCSPYLEHLRISPLCSLLRTAGSHAVCPAQQLGGLTGSQIGRHTITIHTTTDSNKDPQVELFMISDGDCLQQLGNSHAGTGDSRVASTRPPA